MIWRNLCLARALAASGLLSMSCTLALPTAGRADDQGVPAPAADGAVETVSVLDAQRLGTLGVEVRGNGEETVRVKLSNKGARKLRVVLPPGLVASSAVGQGGAGGGGGGGFQSMGLGAVGNQAGGFGRFAQGGSGVGFRSVAPSDADAEGEVDPNAVAVPAGQTVDFTVPAVCLNFGAPTPTGRNRFQLVDVATFTPDARVQRALRTLATVGTSHGVAQAAMWRVANGTSFALMLAQGGKLINPAEVALAGRFVRSLDGSAADLDAPRVFVTVTGDGPAAGVMAGRLQGELDGHRILGMPVQAIAKGATPGGFGPIIHLGIALASGADERSIRGRVVVQVGGGMESLDWSTLGSARLDDLKDGEALGAKALAHAVDGAVASAFVSTKVVRRSANGTTLEVRNRLPMTLASLAVRAGTSANSPIVDVAGLGVGPNRAGQITIPAANATVDRVTLNGL